MSMVKGVDHTGTAVILIKCPVNVYAGGDGLARNDGRYLINRTIVV
jgi:hypothetical protein